MTARTAIPAVLALVVLPAAGAAPASADCCLGGPSARAAFHARSIAGRPVALRPLTTIEVSSEAPADYTARVDIEVGRRIVAHATRHGHSTTTWSRLRIPLSRRQRHAIVAAARREHRRAVLIVQLRGVLQGHTHPDVHAIALVMSGPGMPKPSELPDIGGDQRTRISLAGELVDGARQHLSGKVTIRTPRARFTRQANDAAPSARFEVQVGGTCQASTLAFATALASRADAAGLLTASLRGDRILASGQVAGHSPWAVAAFDTQDKNGEPTGPIALAAQRVVRLAPRRFLRIESYTYLSKACTAADAQGSSLVSDLRRLVTLARVDARIHPGVR